MLSNFGVLPTTGRLPIQPIAYKAYLSHLRPSILVTLVQRRLRYMLDGREDPLPSADEISALFKAARRGTQHASSGLIRMLLHAWTTSYRMRAETFLPCVFGCGPDHKDSLRHYIVCPRLWSTLREGGFYTSARIIGKFGFFDGSWLTAAAATHLYRLVKNSPEALQEELPLDEAARVFAPHVRCIASELPAPPPPLGAAPVAARD